MKYGRYAPVDWVKRFSAVDALLSLPIYRDLDRTKPDRYPSLAVGRARRTVAEFVASYSVLDQRPMKPVPAPPTQKIYTEEVLQYPVTTPGNQPDALGFAADVVLN